MDPNAYEPEFGPEQDEGGFRYRRAKVGLQAGARRLGASVFELEPGTSQFPYHFHFANEELLIVLGGEPDLRDPRGWRRLEEGAVVSFPANQDGGHQLRNMSDKPVRFILVSEMNYPDVVILPDSGKVSCLTGAPGDESTFWHTGALEAAVGLLEGETPPS